MIRILTLESAAAWLLQREPAAASTSRRDMPRDGSAASRDRAAAAAMTRCAAFAMLMAITTACAGETRSADDAATATREAGADTVVGPPADPGSITGRGAAADTVPIDSLPTVRAREVEAEARQRGVDFRGVGQEPGWIVEIDDGVSIVFNGDYGETRATAPAPAPDVEQATGRAVYRARAADGELIVMIEPTTCRDAMSGASYEAAVVLHYAGREYRGCGQYLR